MGLKTRFTPLLCQYGPAGPDSTREVGMDCVRQVLLKMNSFDYRAAGTLYMVQKLLYVLLISEGEILSKTDKNGREQTKMIFILLQIHNRSIECIDSGNLSFFRLLDAIGSACKVCD